MADRSMPLGEDRADTTTEESTPQETAEYLHGFATVLAQMAAGAKLDLLAHLFELAALEALQHGGRRVLH